MNLKYRLNDPPNKIIIHIKSGESYPYGDIIYLSFEREPSEIMDGYYNALSRSPTSVKVNLSRSSVLELIEHLKKAADDALVNMVIEE